MRTYFVIGATGRTGGHIVDALRRQGHGVCGTYRTEQGRSTLESLGTCSAPFDLTTGSEADLAQLMTGSDGVVFAAGSPNQRDANRVDLDGAVLAIDAATIAGVRRFVLLSSIGAGSTVPRSVQGPQFARFYKAKRAADAYLRGSRLDWTILEPGWLTDSPGNGRIEVAQTRLPAASTPRADVAATVAAVLATPAAIGRQFEIVGGSTPVAEALRRLLHLEVDDVRVVPAIPDGGEALAGGVIPTEPVA